RTSLLPFEGYGVPRALHSFPTRRSSDLEGQRPDEVAEAGAEERHHADGEDQVGERQQELGEPTGDGVEGAAVEATERAEQRAEGDRKSTRLNSSHVKISYAVFCLKKKTK